ncbi:PEP-CTERM sorting domain-containing protein [Oscillatoria salina]|uniref:PEP-CTERM sorting domain-containing protein n=1 Tax=Oscillatoria salina TaxID=331517 RepID=UPI0013BB7FDA|nr:PEP-CTERM sorting domain-containing protein [Oscillatoria salina]MBZ8180048.1 PEP-CTERM sorting domain-containing protein [Oscillatoria salina IIICB1]NET88902.1 PEP-CTERM sorting domain-containing protein [Kamptonema sp. SIO1D9]
MKILRNITAGLVGTALVSLGSMVTQPVLAITFDFEGTYEQGSFSGSYAIDEDEYEEAVKFGGTSTFLDTFSFELFLDRDLFTSTGSFAILKNFGGDELDPEINFLFQIDKDGNNGVFSISNIASPLSCLTTVCEGIPSSYDGEIGVLNIFDGQFSSLTITSYSQKPRTKSVPEPSLILGMLLLGVAGGFSQLKTQLQKGN